jgi:hypothetical protein
MPEYSPLHRFCLSPAFGGLLPDLPFDPEYGGCTSFLNVSEHPTDYMVLDALAYSSALRMEAVCASETSTEFYTSKWRYILEDSTLHIPENSTLKIHFACLLQGKLE